MPGRVIAITGASRGIGFRIAKRFAATGELLAMSYRHSADSLTIITEAARSHGGDALIVQVDVAVREECEGFVSDTEQRFGPIDVLIACAGILRLGPSHEAQPTEWTDTIATNLSGTWWTIRAALPGMVARRSGRIITISSELGLMGYPNYAAYSASKAGIIGLTKSLAKEFAPLGILVNSVAPGPVATEMLLQDPIESSEDARQQIPLRRFGEADEIAQVVEFLAGPGGAFFVGQVISPNGGTAI
jgi:3-oxoacyl-[acyl-carrier protein] reductase